MGSRVGTLFTHFIERACATSHPMGRCERETFQQMDFGTAQSTRAPSARAQSPLSDGTSCIARGPHKLATEDLDRSPYAGTHALCYYTWSYGPRSSFLSDVRASSHLQCLQEEAQSVQTLWERLRHPTQFVLLPFFSLARLSPRQNRQPGTWLQC